MSNDDESLTVVWKGEPKFRLNARLVAQKELTAEEVEVVKLLHTVRLDIEEAMSTAAKEDLKALYADWHDNQQYLQRAWHFEQNDNFIRFWTVPQCSCPKMDCEDAYPTGYYTVNCGCPVHGG